MPVLPSYRNQSIDLLWKFHGLISRETKNTFYQNFVNNLRNLFLWPTHISFDTFQKTVWKHTSKAHTSEKSLGLENQVRSNNITQYKRRTVYPLISAPNAYSISTLKGVALKKVRRSFYFYEIPIPMKCQNFIIFSFQITINNYHYDKTVINIPEQPVFIFHSLYTCSICIFT